MGKELFCLLMAAGVILASGCTSSGGPGADSGAAAPFSGNQRAIPLRDMPAQQAIRQIMDANRNITSYRMDMTFFMNLSISFFGTSMWASSTYRTAGDVNRDNKEAAFRGQVVMDTNYHDSSGEDGGETQKTSVFSVTVKDGRVTVDQDGNVTTRALTDKEWESQDYLGGFAGLLNGSTFGFLEDAHDAGADYYVLNITPASMDALKETAAPPVEAGEGAVAPVSNGAGHSSYAYTVWVNKVNLRLQKVHAEIATSGTGYGIVTIVDSGFTDMK